MKEESRAVVVVTGSRVYFYPEEADRGFFMAKFTASDKKFMNMALRLARKGKNRVFPNPMVGAVIVKYGKVIGRGYHKQFGGPHAEIYALEQAGIRARGAVLYVTLEPCAHWGKTPPCADLIIRSGISRVIAACQDPNPQTAGKGFNKIRRKGIKVDTNLYKNKALEQNSAYFSRFRAKKPWL